jgi:hypothetical protein
MAFTAKVPGFGKLDKEGARQSISGEGGGGRMQPSSVPQQNPRKIGGRGKKGRFGSRKLWASSNGVRGASGSARVGAGWSRASVLVGPTPRCSRSLRSWDRRNLGRVVGCAAATAGSRNTGGE